MENQVNAVSKAILEKILPKKEDRAKIDAIVNDLETKIGSVCGEENVEAIVRVEGSIAKDTWLREDPDVDIFVRLPTSIPRKNLGDVGLKIARKATVGLKQVERFAEHPYLEAFVDGYRVHIVPCYNTKRGEWQSATDRTPYHTDYVKDKLNKNLRNEVRLLKKFMKGIKVYGAEIKIGGFSGYLCELLVLAHGSFFETLCSFAKYSQRTVIDIEQHYAKREKELSLLFPEPLVIVDPVDKARNVASAVRPEKLYTLIGAARAFLQEPTAEFFYPKKPHALSIQELKSKIEKRGSSLVFIIVHHSEFVPDILWGQLYKTKKALHKLIELNGHKVLNDAVWSNEKNLSIFFFEVEQQILPNIKKHLGPQLEREKECENFLSKYQENANVISGPYIEQNRWVVELQRKNPDVIELLKEKLSDGGKNSGVASIVEKAFKEKLQVVVNNEISQVYQENKEFTEFLSSFIDGKPFWLKTKKGIIA